ncbi:MAG: hypothetical protein HXY44_06335 [Syntrophaceae bacterium]|nr:hypothetical protein [Syntrophaceae bacterium]
MNELSLNISPAKWHTCVSTVKCDAIDDHVSIMVKSDWTSHCTWYRQLKDQPPGSAKKKPDKKTQKKMKLCQGPLCSYVIGYRDQLIKEEQKATSAPEIRG